MTSPQPTDAWSESPIFIKTDAMLVWLMGCTEKFPKAQRFRLAQRLEDAGFEFQRLIQAAARKKGGGLLADADVQLALLKRRLRMAQEMRRVRCAYRNMNHPDNRNDNIGFRCVRIGSRSSRNAARPRTRRHARKGELQVYSGPVPAMRPGTNTE